MQRCCHFALFVLFAFAPLVAHGQSAATATTAPAPQSAADWTAHYRAALAPLIPQAAADDLTARRAAQQQIETLCNEAARPGPAEQLQGLAAALAESLKPDVPHAARVWLLRQAARLDTDGLVRPLATILVDEQDAELRELARRALQTKTSSEAALVLHGALHNATQPDWQVALIDVLAARREHDAVSTLAELATNTNDAVAAAAMAGLGDIGDAPALMALQGLAASAPTQRQAWVIDARLRGAEQALRDGDRAQAAATFRDLLTSVDDANVRIGALRGIVAAEGADASQLVLDALLNDKNPLPMRQALADLLAEVPGPRVSGDLTRLFPQLPPAGQVLALRALAARARAGTAYLEAAVAEAGLSSPHAEVRLAAVEALGTLGDRSSVPLLVALLRSNEETPEVVAAREVLARLTDPGVDAALLALLTADASPALAQNVIGIVHARRAKDAAAAMATLAQAGDLEVRRAALEAVADLGQEREIPTLVALLAPQQPEEVRDATVAALTAICKRRAEQRSAPILASFAQTSAGQHVGLVRVLGRIGDDAALVKVREAAATDDQDMADAGIRALAAWPTPAALGDLRKLIETSRDLTYRRLAVEGYVRLLDHRDAGGMTQRLAGLKELLALPLGEAERQIVLSSLGRCDLPECLKLALEVSAAPNAGPASEAAVVSVAQRVGLKDLAAARAALEHVQTQGKSETSRKAAGEALTELAQYDGYLFDWQVAGPLRLEGHDLEKLHAAVLPPEEPNGNVTWQPLAADYGKKSPWVFDLQPLDKGKDVCVYVRTFVWAPQAEKLRLEIGSDDGVKAWVNGKLVDDVGKVRGLAEFEDKVSADLQSGWNTVMLKVSQGDGNWAFCARLRTEDDQPPQGLRTAAVPQKD